MSGIKMSMSSQGIQAEQAENILSEIGELVEFNRQTAWASEQTAKQLANIETALGDLVQETRQLSLKAAPGSKQHEAARAHQRSWQKATLWQLSQRSMFAACFFGCWQLLRRS